MEIIGKISLKSTSTICLMLSIKVKSAVSCSPFSSWFKYWWETFWPLSASRSESSLKLMSPLAFFKDRPNRKDQLILFTTSTGIITNLFFSWYVSPLLLDMISEISHNWVDTAPQHPQQLTGVFGLPEILSQFRRHFYEQINARRLLSDAHHTHQKNSREKIARGSTKKKNKWCR